MSWDEAVADYETRRIPSDGRMQPGYHCSRCLIWWPGLMQAPCPACERDAVDPSQMR